MSDVVKVKRKGTFLFDNCLEHSSDYTEMEVPDS